MSLYLHPSITPETIAEAAATKGQICGVKVYPQGVTTNSESGVTSLEQFYPVFAAMEHHDLVLNLHGEVRSGRRSDITSLNAEEAFLPTLSDLHQRFPKLRIVLEHISSARSIAAVKLCGPTVAGKFIKILKRAETIVFYVNIIEATITCHHLYLNFEDVLGDPLNFCRPVAKLESDRELLLSLACSGNSKFFLYV